MNGLPGQVGHVRMVQQRLQGIPPPHADIALLPPAIALQNDREVDPYQWPDVGRQHTIRIDHQYDFVGTGEAGHHLLHPRVQCARTAVQRLQELDFGRITERRHRVLGQIQAGRLYQRCDRDAPGARLRGRTAVPDDGTGGTRCLHQCRLADVVRVGKTGPLACQSAHTDALVDAVRAFLDDAVLQRPRLFPRPLEIKFRLVKRMLMHDAQHFFETVECETRRHEDRVVREPVGIIGRNDGVQC